MISVRTHWNWRITTNYMGQVDDGLTNGFSTGFGGTISRADLDESIGAVNDVITDSDWRDMVHMSSMISDSIASEGVKRTKRRIVDFMNSDDSYAVRLRDYFGDGVNIDDIGGLIVNEVGSMTRKSVINRSGGKPSIRRCVLTRTANDMNRRRYIASILFFSGRCCYCGAPLRHGTGNNNDDPSLTASGEHIDPLAGHPPGETRFGNMALACVRCNSDKRDRGLDEWIESTGMLDDHQKTLAMRRIMTFRRYSLYEPMSHERESIVESAISRLNAIAGDGECPRWSPQWRDRMSHAINDEIMRIMSMD